MTRTLDCSRSPRGIGTGAPEPLSSSRAKTAAPRDTAKRPLDTAERSRGFDPLSRDNVAMSRDNAAVSREEIRLSRGKGSVSRGIGSRSRATVAVTSAQASKHRAGKALCWKEAFLFVPIGSMKGTFSVYSLISMCSEVIALSLNEIGWQAFGPKRFEVLESR